MAQAFSPLSAFHLTKISTLIADDELDACEGLQMLLSADEDIQVVSICRNGSEAVRSINQHKPDLVFLDIQMPGGNGFEVLDQLSYRPSAIVFVTAYDEYALNAFEVHALDYLQKPFSDERFYDMLSHVKQQLQKQEFKDLSTIENSLEALPNKLKIKSSGITYLLNYEELLHIEGYDYYIKVHTVSQSYLVRESLKKLLERLPKQFRQIHKSHIINTQHLRSLEPLSRGAYELTLSNGKLVAASRNYRHQLVDFL